MNHLIATEVARRGTGAKIALARAVGVTSGAVSRWVSGASMPDPKHWEAIESHLEMEPGSISASAGDLLTLLDHGDGIEVPPALSEAIRLLGDETRLLRSELAELRTEHEQLRREVGELRDETP